MRCLLDLFPADKKPIVAAGSVPLLADAIRKKEWDNCRFYLSRGVKLKVPDIIRLRSPAHRLTLSRLL